MKATLLSRSLPTHPYRFFSLPASQPQGGGRVQLHPARDALQALPVRVSRLPGGCSQRAPGAAQTRAAHAGASRQRCGRGNDRRRAVGSGGLNKSVGLQVRCSKCNVKVESGSLDEHEVRRSCVCQGRRFWHEQ